MKDYEYFIQYYDEDNYIQNTEGSVSADSYKEAVAKVVKIADKIKGRKRQIKVYS
jgi:hypothetical protein